MYIYTLVLKKLCLNCLYRVLNFLVIKAPTCRHLNISGQTDGLLMCCYIKVLKEMKAIKLLRPISDS